MFMSPASSAAEASRAPVDPSGPKRRRAEWPPERLDQLRRLFEAGLSHALIAGRMGVGKGPISAKIARLGWRRGETSVTAAPAGPAPLIVDPGRMKRLEQLAAADCHWPTIDDVEGVQLFCGMSRPDGQSYCAGHQARAHRRPVGWERRALEPATRPPPREGLGWERFPVRDGLACEARSG
ncbi:MAG: hypothetical protein GC145_08550 [Caulobacter sp.]|nr:hypothetical protein [Caulobacter sp.]